MDNKKVMQQALEALESGLAFDAHSTVLQNLRKALAQPVQEPVACRFCHSKKGCWAWQCYQCGEIDDVQQPPPQPLPVQEPVKLHKAVISAWGLREVYFDKDGSPSMHRSPPQRPWVGLTKPDMPSGEDPMFDHQYFIAGMVYAAKILQAKNT